MEDLGKHGALLRAYDPKANWKEVQLPTSLTISDSPYEAIKEVDMAVLLTEWPDFLTLDFERIKAQMAQPILFDTKNMLRARYQELERLGFKVITIGRA
jgi:UDPglucose 6-dehydrogenase